MEDAAERRLQRNIAGGETSKKHHGLHRSAHFSLVVRVAAGGWAEGSSLWVCLRVPQHPESGAQDQGGEERVRLCGDHGLSRGYVTTATCPVTPWVEVSGAVGLWCCGSARLPERGRTGEAASWAEPEDVDAGSGGEVPARGRHPRPRKQSSGGAGLPAVVGASLFGGSKARASH